MIQALLRYAEDRGLASKPGYAKKQVKWVLEFDPGGSTFARLVPSDREFAAAPDLSFPELRRLGAQRGQASHFLVAPLGTFLGWAKGDDSETERGRRQTLCWMLDLAGSDDGSLSMLAETIARANTSETCLAQISNMRPAPRPTDLATVRLGTRFPVEDSCWHAWWDTFRQSLRGEATDGGEMVSFVTGEPVQPITTYPKLKNLSGVGLSQPHAPLITFDKEAYESYGLSQARNAASDEETAVAVMSALDHLVENSVLFAWRRPKPSEPRQLARDFSRLGGARFAYWYTGEAEPRTEVEQANDLIGMVFGGPVTRDVPPDDDEQDRVLAEARLRRAIDRIRSGNAAVPLVGVRFCAAALSGAAGRVMLRDFIEGSVLDLANAADRWFSDLSLVRWSGTMGRSPALERVLTAPLVPKQPDQDYSKWVRPAGAWRQPLWRAALLGGPLPGAAVGRSLEAHSRTVVNGELMDDEVAARARGRARLRLALAKAHLLRRGVHMTPALDPEHPSPEYHCGRLLALYDALQRAALGDVGAGVVQRYYGGAISNPSGVFGQLSRLAHTHLSKLGGGLAHLYESQIAEAHNGIRRNADGPASYPQALDQDGQALFALGFWHQTADINREIAEAAAAKKAHAASPAAATTEDIEP